MNNAATNIHIQVSGEFRSCHLGKYLGNRIVRLYYKGNVQSIYFIFEIGSHCVTLTGLELRYLLASASQWWDQRQVPHAWNI